MENKNIIKNSFWHLLGIYSLIILAIAFGFFSKYTLHFNVLALIIGLFGISLITRDKTTRKEKHNKNKQIFSIIAIIISIILILVFRIVPYVENSIPLGYDAGLYKYAIEQGLENLDTWVVSGVEPGFLYFMNFLNLFISTWTLLTVVFISFNVLLGIAVYAFTRTYFGKREALISLIIFSLSLVQFRVFTLLYYKNIIALSLLLFSFIFLKKEKYVLFILFGILIGIIHRPTAFIFGLSYLSFAVTSPYFHSKKQYDFTRLLFNIGIGIIMLLVSMLFYIGNFQPIITNMIQPVLSSFVETGQSPGTFISFFEYQFAILFYLPLALLGLFSIVKNRKFDIFFFYTVILGIIVYFQFFFFNRFIIFLDVALIILAGIGASLLITEKKKTAIVILSILFISGFVIMTNVSLNTYPEISQDVFDAINLISISEKAYIISFSGNNSPYLQGYTKNKIIAPGMFDYDIWESELRWREFWMDLDASELKQEYNEEIYLFIAQDLNDSCYELESKYLYKYVC